MKKIRIVLIILMVVLILLQLIAYLSVATGHYRISIEKINENPNDRQRALFKFAYYFGLNIYIIPIPILFFISRYIKLKLRRSVTAINADVNMIGK